MKEEQEVWSGTTHNLPLPITVNIGSQSRPFRFITNSIWNISDQNFKKGYKELSDQYKIELTYMHRSREMKKHPPRVIENMKTIYLEHRLAETANKLASTECQEPTGLETIALVTAGKIKNIEQTIMDDIPMALIRSKLEVATYSGTTSLPLTKEITK